MMMMMTMMVMLMMMMMMMMMISYSGGTGAMVYTLCQYYPNMKITVCEMQSVVDSVHHFTPSLEDCANQPNVSFVVGDIFQPDLPKAELYVLSRILHDWPEEKVNLILSNVFKCLPSGERLNMILLHS